MGDIERLHESGLAPRDLLIYCSSPGCETLVTLREGDLIPEAWTCGPCNRAAMQDAEIAKLRAKVERLAKLGRAADAFCRAGDGWPSRNDVEILEVSARTVGTGRGKP